jgi:hypothetical protein
MSTKIFLGIMLIILSVGGYVVYNNYLAEEDAAPLTIEGISFMCEDGSHFIAEFSPDFASLNIVVDGVTTRSLARASGDNARYEYSDRSFTYLFAGEEVRVTNTETGEATSCQQPFDPNTAPYNFGDLGEGGGEEQDLALAVTENILGIWQSTEDESFTREFRAGGIAIDAYEGSTATEGTWTAFTSESNVATPFTQQPDVIYLEMRMGGGQDEILYFTVVKLTPEELDLTYLDRGGILSFVSVEEEL